MKNLSLLCFLLFFLFSCTTGWKQKSNYDSPLRITFTRPDELQQMKDGRYGHGYAADEDYLYAVNGCSNLLPVYFDDILRYDIKNNQWSKLTDKLIAKRYCSVEYLNGKLFILNGIQTNQRVNDRIEIVDVNSGEVQTLTGNPRPVNMGGSATWQGKLYIFGGGRYEPQGPRTFANEVWEYNPAQSTWKLLTQMARGREVQGEIVDGVLYLFGGFYGEISPDIEAYNIATNTWTRLESIKEKIYANAIVRHGKFIWLVGSYQNFNTLAVFDAVTRKLHFVNSNILGSRYTGAAIVANKLYVYGGLRSKEKNALESIQAADITEVEAQLVLARQETKQ